MASRSAGTLITTNNATFISPAQMPSYKGYIPNLQDKYGETFGNKTQKYFQDYRSETLNQSRSRYDKGGYFPTFYSNDPTLVMKSRLSQERHKIRTHPNWERYTNHSDRSTELKQLDLKIQKHRDYYRDKTWCRHRENYFLLPVNNEDKLADVNPYPLQQGGGYIDEDVNYSTRIPPRGNNPSSLIQSNISLRQGFSSSAI